MIRSRVVTPDFDLFTRVLRRSAAESDHREGTPTTALVKDNRSRHLQSRGSDVVAHTSDNPRQCPEEAVHVGVVDIMGE